MIPTRILLNGSSCIFLDNLPSLLWTIESARMHKLLYIMLVLDKTMYWTSGAGEVATILIHMITSQYDNGCACCSHWGGWVQTDLPFQLAVEYKCPDAPQFSLIRSWKNNIEVVKENNNTNHMVIFQINRMYVSEKKLKGTGSLFPIATAAAPKVWRDIDLQ